MITTDLKRLLKWLPVMLLPLLISSCSDSDEEPAPDEEQPGEEVLSAWTPEQIAHSTLVANFFDLVGTDDNGNVYSPSKGIAIDEAKPSERSEACDSYEKALEKFECALPTGENDEQYIHRADNGITVDLGNLGSVKFSVASGEGVVAKADIRLKDAPNYTLLYRNVESFGDNYSSDQNLHDIFHPGDLVEFRCHENVITNYWDEDQTTLSGDEERDYWKWDICGNNPRGIVIDATAHSVSVFTTHTHYYRKFDKKKDYFLMHYKLISAEGWKRVYNSWRSNRDCFLNTYENTYKNIGYEICQLKEVMEGTPYARYVVVEGTDFERKQKYHLGSARWLWYSWQKRIKISDLRNGNFTTKYVRYADGTKLANTYREDGEDKYDDRVPDVRHYSLIEFNRDQAECIKVLYPQY